MRCALPWLLCASLALLAGCQKARPYTPRPAVKLPLESKVASSDGAKAPEFEPPLPADIAWMDLGRHPGAKDVRIVFVHESADEWSKLPAFWNEVPPEKDGQPLVKIKVPLGLEDPLENIPITNPPTRGKWELGRRLFFDPAWLTSKGKDSCATCHQPANGFTSDHPDGGGGYNAPTLVNVVFSKRLFWDGRVRYLEEVVQQTLEDEREPKHPQGFRHVWPGVIGRLRGDKKYMEQFTAVFGVQPTQDTLGKAIATYLRTLLAGNSIYDQARAAQRQKEARALTAEHFEPLLNEATLKALDRPAADKAKVAAELLQGHALFHGKAACQACHPTSNGYLSDSGFYNIGIEAEKVYLPKKPHLGRFAVAPLGEKNRYLLGAYKVPTLRGLSRTRPYFHDGSTKDLTEAVRLHVQPPKGTSRNLYLDARLATPDGGHKDFGLKDDEISALVLFLKALDGDEVDRFVMDVPK